jgi:hypothetical protein
MYGVFTKALEQRGLADPCGAADNRYACLNIDAVREKIAKCVKISISLD